MGFGTSFLEEIKDDEDGNCHEELYDYLIPTAVETPKWRPTRQ